jgi:pimeloyl-ACP methyl ester carboxylesterase
MGCGEATRYLTRHGAGRVSRLAFLAPATPRLRQGPDFPEGTPSTYFEDMRQSWQKDFPDWLTENAPPFFGEGVSPAITQWCIQAALQCSLKAAIACNQSLEHADFRAEFAAIDLPTLILHGDADVSAPLDLTARPSSRLLKNSRLEIYPGAAHGLVFTHLDRVNRDLSAFLKEPSVAS